MVRIMQLQHIKSVWMDGPTNPENALGARKRSNNKLDPQMTWVRFDPNLAQLSVRSVSWEFFYDCVINSELEITFYFKANLKVWPLSIYFFYTFSHSNDVHTCRVGFLSLSCNACKLSGTVQSAEEGLILGESTILSMGHSHSSGNASSSSTLLTHWDQNVAASFG